MAPYTNPGCFWRRFRIVFTSIPFSSSSRSWVVGASHLRRGRERDVRVARRALGDVASRSRSSRHLRSEVLSLIYSWVLFQPTDTAEDPIFEPGLPGHAYEFSTPGRVSHYVRDASLQMLIPPQFLSTMVDWIRQRGDCYRVVTDALAEFVGRVLV